MKTHFPFLTAVALAVAVPGLFAADLTGKVTLKGTPPPELTIQMDATCGKLHSGPVTTRHYLTAPDGGLANVFVYIKSGLSGKTFEPPKETPILDQVNCMYEPFVMGVMTNQKFKARNSDSFLHNVHPMPRIAGNLEKNIAQPIKGMETEFSFPKQEVLVRFKCEVHAWMFAYVGVLDHPYFAVTGKDGTFKIPNLPAGKYTIEAYHLKTHGANPGVTQEITVDGDKKVDFTVELKGP
jgi:hypothetical protein